MPRTHLRTALVATTTALASLAGGLTAPAEAAWSRPGTIVKYQLCRGPADGGDSWRFVSRVTKRRGTEEFRAGLTVRAGRDRAAGWRTGWVEDRTTRRSVVRVAKDRRVHITVWMEAGDRDSVLGTAAEAERLKPWQVRRCSA